MEWRTIPGVDPRYEVSDTGLVRSWCANSGKRAESPRLLKQAVDKDGYLRVDMRVSNKDKHFLVHRLVLRAFVGGTGMQTNHKDGVRNNNTVANLEWCTASENVRHAYDVLDRKASSPNTGRFSTAHWGSKPVRQHTLGGVLVQVWGSLADAARAGYAEAGISRACNGITKTHKGFVWAFTNQTTI